MEISYNSGEKRINRINKVSNALIRKSLELSGYEDTLKGKQQEKKKKRHNGYTGALELIPVKHRFISSKEKADINTVLRKSSKTTIYEAKKRLEAKQDCTEENVQRLLALGKNCVSSDTVKKILNCSVKTGRQRQKKEKESESTAFTEEDFKKFELEYVDQ